MYKSQFEIYFDQSYYFKDVMICNHFAVIYLHKETELVPF